MILTGVAARLIQVGAPRAVRWSSGHRDQWKTAMIAFEFDGALQASSGVAEALHAAGADVCVPAWAEMVEADTGEWKTAEWTTAAWKTD